MLDSRIIGEDGVSPLLTDDSAEQNVHNRGSSRQNGGQSQSPADTSNYDNILSSSDEESGSKISGLIIIAAIVAAVGGVLFGYDTGVISGAILQLKRDFNLSCSQQEFVISALLIGSLVGSLTGGFLVDGVGRRRTILINAAQFCIGALILSFATTYTTLIIGRLVLGYAVSVSAIAECVYISEISPPKQRGLLVSLNELAITLGLLLAYAVNYFFINVSHGWRWMFGLSVGAAVLQGTFMLFLPSSPRFLVMKKRETAAEKSLERLHGPGGVKQTLKIIKLSEQIDKSHSVFDVCRTANNMRSRLFVAFGLVFFQQITGQPNVLYYAPTIFHAVGFSSDSAATLATVLMGATKVMATLFALAFVDKAGRRRFLICGVSLMCISVLCLSITANFVPVQTNSDPCKLALQSDLISSNNDSTEFSQSLNESQLFSSPFPHSEVPDSFVRVLSLFAFLGFVVGYAVSFGPMTWLILSEIFPTSIKGRAVSLATVLNGGTNLIISLTFLHTMSALHVTGAFFMFSCMCALSVIFIFLCVPETRGKSLERINVELNQQTLKQRIIVNLQWLFRPCCGRKVEQLAFRVHYDRMSTDDINAVAISS